MTRAAYLCGYLAGLDSTSQFFVFPEIRTSLADGDTAAASWTLTIAGIVGAVALLQAGRLCDRFGHDRVLIGAAGVVMAGSMLAVAAPTLLVLVIARGVQAAGLASLGVSSISVIVRDTPTAKLATVLGAWGFWTALSGVSGPLFASVLIGLLSWRWLYLVEVLVAATVVWAASPGWSRPRPGWARSRVDVLGTTLVAVGLALVVLALLEGNDWGWASAQTAGALAGGAALLAFVVRRSRHHDDPVVPLEPFRTGGFVTATLTQSLATVGFFAMWLAMLTYMTEVWDYTLVRAGLLLTMMPGGMALTSRQVGRYVDKHGPRGVVLGGCGLVSFGFATTALLVDAEPRAVLMLPAILSAGPGMSTILLPTTRAATRVLAEHQLGAGTALLQTLGKVAGGLGPAAVVALLGSGISGDPATHRLAIWLVVATMVAAGLVAFNLDRS